MTLESDNSCNFNYFALQIRYLSTENKLINNIKRMINWLSNYSGIEFMIILAKVLYKIFRG